MSGNAPGAVAANPLDPLNNPLMGSQGPSDEWTTNDILIYGGVFGVFAIVCIVFLFILLQGRRKKKKEKLIVNDDQIGNYRPRGLIQTGATSQVWEVSEMSSGRHFAIKMLLPECAHDAVHRKLLFHEAEIGQKLAHENIIRVVSVVRDKDHPHFVMDFFPGGNLKLRVMHKEFDFIKEKALEIFKQTATALAYIHVKGWVHRDIKPENILVNAAGAVRIIDFAIARRVKQRGRRGEKVQGTRTYMSPEQIRNERLDGRADIYSFGCAAYEIVTGRPPFRGANSEDLLKKHISEKPLSPRAHNPEVTEEFANLVLKMLEKDRAKRPDSFHTILGELKKMRVFRRETVAKPKTDEIVGR
jgi:serine/threonine protein kinase